MNKKTGLEEGKIDCPKCLGVGEVLKEDHFGVKICPKCKGKGTLDWIENIMGVQGTYVKPGVYVKEVDYSAVIKPGEDCEIFWIGEDNGK